MPIHIPTRKLREFLPGPLLLETSNGSALPDTRALQSSGCFSSLLFYDSRCPGFCIRESSYFLGADTGRQENSPANSILELQFVLHHSLVFRLEGGPKKTMAEGHYDMITSSDVRKINWFDKANSQTRTLDIHFSPAYLQNVGGLFPELADLLRKKEQGLTALLGSSPAITSPTMKRMIDAILDCPHTGDLRLNYIDSKVSVLLLLAVEQISSHPALEGTASYLKRYDREKIHEARQYMLLNMENPPTLKELSHQVGLNVFKLKKGYKQIFGVTIFEDFKRERMNKAMNYLLEENRSIDDTALLIGYEDSPNFIRAFKIYFGTPPGECRKRHEQLNGKPTTVKSGRPPGNHLHSSVAKRRP